MKLDNWNNIYIFAIIIIFCPLIGKIVRSSLEFYKLSKENSSTTTLVNSLNRLTPKEFQIWCSEYLSYLGYSDIILSPISSEQSTDTTFILCTKEKKSYYVQCERNPDNNLITSRDVENLLGILISKSLSNGIIISTSSLSKDTLTFIETLPKQYSIQTILLNTIDESSLNNYPLQLN